jgi:hypothetical protein
MATTKVLRVLSVGVVGHAGSKLARCTCGRVHAPQPSAAKLAGALPADVVPAPPDLFARVAADRTKPVQPSDRPVIPMPPPPREGTLEPLNSAELVPSPSFESFADTVAKSRRYKQ